MEQEGQKQGDDEHLEKGEISLSRGGPQSLPRVQGIRESRESGQGFRTPALKCMEILSRAVSRAKTEPLG